VVGKFERLDVEQDELARFMGYVDFWQCARAVNNDNSKEIGVEVLALVWDNLKKELGEKYLCYWDWDSETVLVHTERRA
jgi:hypothetical protein